MLASDNIKKTANRYKGGLQNIKTRQNYWDNLTHDIPRSLSLSFLFGLSLAQLSPSFLWTRTDQFAHFHCLNKPDRLICSLFHVSLMSTNEKPVSMASTNNSMVKQIHKWSKCRSPLSRKCRWPLSHPVRVLFMKDVFPNLSKYCCLLVYKYFRGYVY